MAHDRLRDSGLVQALTDLFADLADLLRTRTAKQISQHRR
jgi:hypothetical protein